MLDSVVRAMTRAAPGTVCRAACAERWAGATCSRSRAEVALGGSRVPCTRSIPARAVRPRAECARGPDRAHARGPDVTPLERAASASEQTSTARRPRRERPHAPRRAGKVPAAARRGRSSRATATSPAAAGSKAGKDRARRALPSARRARSSMRHRHRPRPRPRTAALRARGARSPSQRRVRAATRRAPAHRARGRRRVPPWRGAASARAIRGGSARPGGARGRSGPVPDPPRRSSA